MAKAKRLSRRLQRSLMFKYRRMLKAKDRAAAQYELADRLALEIALKSEGKVIPISDAKGIQAVDQVKAALNHPKRKPDQMPKLWGHSAVRLFEIEEVKLSLES